MSLGLPGLDTDQAPSWPGLRALLQQLPPQDSDERYCLALGEEELAELRLFCAQRRQEALGQGVARLVTPKLEEHTCEKACGQALIKLIYFYHDGRLYCGRHHAELLRPRCPACDQLIFSSRCTEAEGRRWHQNHFCCQDCAGPLSGGRYALPGGGPCCPSCFESRYSDASSSPAPTLERRESPGKGEALLAAAASSGPETQRGLLGSRLERAFRDGDKAEAPEGRELDCLELSSDPKEVSSCPTCSSSSDSEPEGFFLGQRLPRPGKAPGTRQAGDSDTSRKHCTIC